MTKRIRADLFMGVGYDDSEVSTGRCGAGVFGFVKLRRAGGGRPAQSRGRGVWVSITHLQHVSWRVDCKHKTQY